MPLGSGIPEPGLLSTTDVAGSNRAHVLQALADHGPLSRADLARLAGVSRASIGSIVAGLLHEGILREQPVIANTGRVGKPSRPLWFGDTGTYGAVVVQPQAIEVAIVSAHGRIGDRTTIRTRGLDRQSYDRQILDDVRAFLAPHASALQAIGLAVPAVFDPDGALVASTTIPALVGSRLPTGLAQALDTTVVLEDDARSLALGQRWFGQARGERAFAALQIGEGIGAGIMLEGRLHRGSLMVSEVGHTTVDLHGARCRCGLTGCWETVASLRWLRARADELGLTDDATMTPGQLTRRHQDGDARATTLIEEYADHVAAGIVNLFHVLALPLFILHGAVTDGGDPFLERLRRRAHDRTMPAMTKDPQIIFAQDETDSGVLGAAAAAVTFSLGVRI